MLYRVCANCHFRIAPHTGACQTCGTRATRRTELVNIVDETYAKSRLQRTLERALEGLRNDAVETRDSVARACKKLMLLIRGSVDAPRTQRHQARVPVRK
ncbi:MAG TPA: hypothetical protein V6C81_22550 [Planktothrix sp.]